MHNVKKVVLAVVAAALVVSASAGPGRAGGVTSRDPRVRPVLGPVETVTALIRNDSSPGFGNVRVVANRSGVATAAWYQEGGPVIAQRGVDGRWRGVVALPPCGVPGCRQSVPALAVDGQGTVTAAWAESEPHTVSDENEIYVSSRPWGGSWSIPVLLTRSARVPHGWFPAVVAADNGAALVTFPFRRPGHVVAVAAFHRSRGASWSAARRHVVHRAGSPSVGMSAHGRAVVVVRGLGRHSRLRAYRVLRSHRWLGPSYLGRVVGSPVSGDASSIWAIPIAVAVGRDGAAVVVWPSHTIRRPSLQARTMSPRGRWGRTTILSRAGTFWDYYAYGNPQPMAAFRDGTATVVWPDVRAAVRVAWKTTAGRWRVGTAYRRGSGYPLALGAGRKGRLSLLWVDESVTGSRLYAGLYRPAGGWSARVRVPVRWMGDEPMPDAGAATLPGGAAVVVAHTTEAGPEQYPPYPWTEKVIARTVRHTR